MKLNNSIQKSGLLIAVCLLMSLFLTNSLLADDDVLVRALNDEMGRSLTGLKLEDNDPPYYMGYVVNLENNCSITAEYGSIINCDCTQANQAFLDLRVGSYQFDNSNVLSGFRGLGMETINLPRDLEYSTIRKTVWLADDQAYKDAVEALALKTAILQSQIPDDTIPDLSPADPVVSMGELYKPQVDTTAWKTRLEKLSAMFEKYPQFNQASIQLNTKTENRYIINSEGTAIRHGRDVHYLFIQARAMDKSGLPVYQYDRIVVDDMKDFPNDKELQKWVQDFIDRAIEMINAETIDDYIGPVLFTQRAAVQAFSALFIENISNPRKPVTPDSRYDQYLNDPKLVRKIGFRVMPDFISISDDPAMDIWNGQKLLGHYQYDDDGVPGMKINLVEDGKLRNYYMSRVPTKKFENSNGHGRLQQSGIGAVEVVGKPANVIMTSTETHSFEELKQQMLELCRDMDIEYGLIIDQMNFSGQPESDNMMNFFGGSSGPLPNVLNGYLVSVRDGSLKPVRSLEFINVSERALKDILAVGDDFAASTLMFDRSFNNLASVVIPSILIEEMELKKASFQAQKPPIAENPYKRK